MKALIDGDILVYRAGYAAQKTLHVLTFNESLDRAQFLTKKLMDDYIKKNKLQGLVKTDIEIRPEPVENALHSCKLMIQDILLSVGTDEHKILLTSNDKSNYRFDIAKTQVYKGNRKQPKPVHYEALREYLIKNWNAEVIEGKEADDELGILQTNDTIICSIDKDLRMIPGHHYNFVTKEKELIQNPGYLKLENNNRKLVGGGLKWFYAQMLLGDSADNIPGIPGYGPVKVHATLGSAVDELELVKRTYDSYLSGLNEHNVVDRFLEVADLLWIQKEPLKRKSEQLKNFLHELGHSEEEWWEPQDADLDWIGEHNGEPEE